MDIEKQREVIRLWNRMRKVEGPIAEEIRIQNPRILCRAGAHQARGLIALSIQHAAALKRRRRARDRSVSLQGGRPWSARP